MAYDVKCFELAQIFLEDEQVLQHPRHAALLAQHIQSVIEDWIEQARERDNYEPSDPPGFEGGSAGRRWKEQPR